MRVARTSEVKCQHKVGDVVFTTATAKKTDVLTFCPDS